MVDRTAIRFPSQVGSAGTRKGTGGRERPDETTENCSTIRRRTDRCHSSRVKGAVIDCTGEPCNWLSAAQMADHAKAPARTGSERTPVRELRTAAGNDGEAARCTAGGRLAQLVRALP